jgi:hypothetical protein
MNNSAASQEEREKESGRGGKIKSKLAHQQSFFCCFPLALSQPTERKSNRSKKGSPKPKTDESGRRSGRDGLPHLHTHTKKIVCLAFDIGPFRRKALVRLAKKIVGRRPLRKWHREDPGALTDRARQG